MTDVTITTLPTAPLHALEVWSNPAQVAERFRAATGFDLPPSGRSGGNEMLRLIRFEPTVWLVEGDFSSLPPILGQDGTLTAIGGGIVRVRLSGRGWRSLLMEWGVFDAESPAFAPGCSAATVIDQVNVRLLVESESACLAYVPASYSTGLIHLWETASRTLV